MSSSDLSVNDAWQQALASEHQAVFGYGALGPRLAEQDQQATARSALAAHEDARDSAAALLSARGQRPADPLADYAGVYPVLDAAAARTLALRLEQDCAAAWRHAYAAAASGREPSGSLRTTARQALTDCAVRATRWRSFSGVRPTTVPFPGI